MQKIMVLMLLGFLVFTGCKKDNTALNNYTPSCSGAAKSYKADVAPIIESACAGCHQNYSSYSGLSGSQSSVRSMIASGQMPKGGSLTDAQKNAIICWIDSGAANN
jgi:hypothetical protein